MTRTATWEQDRRGGHRARPGALQPRALRQGTWAALDRAAAGRADPVGGPCLGAAVPHGARPLRALHPAAAPSLRRSKPLTRWARHLIRLVQRGQPDRPLVVVGDRTDAAVELLSAVRAAATVVARLRRDAQLCAPAPPRRPRQTGRPRLVGARLPHRTTDVDDRRRRPRDALDDPNRRALLRRARPTPPTACGPRWLVPHRPNRRPAAPEARPRPSRHIRH